AEKQVVFLHRAFLHARTGQSDGLAGGVPRLRRTDPTSARFFFPAPGPFRVAQADLRRTARTPEGDARAGERPPADKERERPGCVAMRAPPGNDDARRMAGVVRCRRSATDGQSSSPSISSA